MVESCHAEAVTPALPGARQIALIGRPNSGKSSLFNLLTGRHAHVGNFPGITVDVQEGAWTLPNGEAVTVIDLPGLYSVQNASDPATDEGIAKALLERLPEGALLVQVLDATQLALGLRLTKELLELQRPLLVLATQYDLLERKGSSLDAAQLSEALGVPVLAVSSREPAAAARIAAAIEQHPRTASTPQPALEPSSLARRIVRGDVAAVRAKTAQIDRVMLHPLLGPLLFVAIMVLAFAGVFLIADPVTEVIEGAMGWLGGQLTEWLGEGLLAGFLNDGVLAGAGTVLIFMPQIVVLTVMLELFEATGYLARGAFLVDRLLRALGLSGRSFVPLLMGHACAVPAIGATRILRDPRERLVTLLILPLTACSARLPTYGLILSAFFWQQSVLVRAALFVALYFAGIASAGLAAAVLQKVVVRGKSLPLVLEMPIYRMPAPRLIARKGWTAATRFLRDVGTTIVVASAVLYVLLSVPVREGTDPDEPAIDRSVAAMVGQTLEPITQVAGFDWRINIGLLASFGARELMVGTMGVIMGVEDADTDDAPLAEKLREAKRDDGSPLYTTATACALLAFFVLACQCMSTVAALRRETRGWKWPAFVLGYTYVAAFVAATAVYQLASWIS